MKWLIPLFFFSAQSRGQCLPDSAIFFDKKNSSPGNVLVIENTAREIVHKFAPKLKQDFSVELDINLEMLNPRVNAEINKLEKQLIISVWGGMIRHPKMTPKVMTLLLCHELGHALGGSPYRSRNGWSSTEGQADYYSALHCIKEFDFNQDEFIQTALDLTSIYAEVTAQIPPQADRCDEVKADRMNYGYPKAQCRFDTLISGWHGHSRPACWYVE